jgi:hypothetical protein
LRIDEADGPFSVENASCQDDHASTMRTVRTKAQRIAHDVKLASGLGTELEPDHPFVVKGKTHTSAEVVALLWARIEAAHAVASAKAAWEDAIRAEEALVEKSQPVIDGVVETLRTTLGDGSEELAKLGVAPRKKRRALTAEEAVAAGRKRQATREARGIGKRRRRRR